MKKLVQCDVEDLGDLISTNFLGHFSPPIIKKDGRYEVRILASSYTSRTGHNTTKFDYYSLDENGVITNCPRGLTKEFKGKQVRDIEAKYQEYKAKGM